jgi:hypothetical protein
MMEVRRPGFFASGAVGASSASGLVVTGPVDSMMGFFFGNSVDEF